LSLLASAVDRARAMSDLKILLSTGIVDKFTSAAPAVDWNRTMANLKILPNSGFADKFPCFLLTIPLRFIALNQ
jgi:hypothetical protein